MIRKSLVVAATLGLVLSALPGVALADLIYNGGFETPALEGTDVHGINVSGAGWTFTEGTGGAGSGIVKGSPYDGGTGLCGSHPYAGIQAGFLEGSNDASVTSIEQQVTGFDLGKQYVLSFYARGLENYGMAGNPFYVSLGGATLTFSGNTLVSPAYGADYALYQTGPLTPTAETMTLRFSDQGAQPGTQLTLLDNISISDVPEPCALTLFGLGILGLLAYAWRKK